MARAEIMASNSPISYWARKNNLEITDLARALNVTQPTIREYIKNPMQIRLKDIYILSGLFGISGLELIYLIERNKASSKYKAKKGKFHLSEIMRKVEEDEIRYRKQKDQG